MFLAQTLGLQGDILYLDAQKFLTLASRTPFLTNLHEPDLKYLLDLARVVMNYTMLMSFSQSEAGAKPGQGIDSQRDVSEIMKRHASSTAQQMALQDGTNEVDKTWKILDLHPDLALKSKGILALVAFATMYGKARLVTLVHESNRLANSITLLKQQPNIHSKNDLRNWFESLRKVMKATLDLANRIMDLKETHQLSSDYNKHMRTQILLSTAVYRIVNIVVICWPQVVTILHKHDGKDIPLYLGRLSDCERELNDKLLEIEGTLAKDHAPQQNTTNVSDEQTQVGSLLTRRSSFNCWQILRQTMSYTRSRSLPDLSDVKGSLPRDKEGAQKEATRDGN